MIRHIIYLISSDIKMIKRKRKLKKRYKKLYRIACNRSDLYVDLNIQGIPTLYVSKDSDIYSISYKDSDMKIY